MRNILSSLVAIMSIAILFPSCYSKKNIMYFYDLKDSNTWSAPITNYSNPKFEKDDRISVKVVTIDAGTSNLLNSGVLMNSGGSGGGGAISSTTSNQEGYTVDENGDIYLPYIGKVHAEGLTKTELKNEIAKQISRFIKDPIVYVDWLNFKYTIIGEAGTGVYDLEGDKINVIEAIAKSGDFRQFSERDKVMLIREENGERKMVRLNFQSSEIFNSPYFYLKQNDLIYVEPKKFADQTPQRQLRQITMITSLVTITNSITNIFLTRFLTK